MDDPNKDEKTAEQSNSAEAENKDQAAEGAENQTEETDAGQAAAEGAEQGAEAEDGAQTEGDTKTRGERRHERYIDKLATEIRQSNEQDTRYTQELFTPKSHEPLRFEDGASYDPEDLEKDRQVTAENARAEGVRQGLTQGSDQISKELWADRFDIDSERVTTKYATLNPESDDYDSKLEATLVQKYIQYAGVTKDGRGRVSIEKPGVRFKDFADAEMQNLEYYASRHSEQSSKNVASQAAKTGVRPSGATRPSSGGHGFDSNDPVGSVARMTSKQYFDQGGKEASDAYLAERGLAPKV